MMKVHASFGHMMVILLFSLSIISASLSALSLAGAECVFEWEIFSSQSQTISLVFLFDVFSMFFLSLVFLISGSVSIFSISYMSSEQFFSRFLIILSTFIASMALLITSPNLISLLLGWDGLGVTSYLLVIFYQSKKSYSAGMLTALTNRMGDVGLLICLGLMSSVSSWTFSFYVNTMPMMSALFILILMLAACTKSAQIPFSSWLPAAMAAPTPVSALVHSSTLVTAGVYLLIRFSALFTSHLSSYFLYILGSLTMVMAGLAAMGEMDMKKIIALSTLSQLGVMMLTLGLGSSKMAFFHLLSHAYFKAMLFMCAGSVIHTMKDYQDIRTMSQGSSSSVKVLGLIVVSNLSLCGLPFLSGFYSKDLILEACLMMNSSSLSVFLLSLGTLLTVAYSVRALGLILSQDARGGSVNYTKDSDTWMILGMLCLFPFSVMSGYFLSFMLMSSALSIFLPSNLKGLISLMILAGVLIGHISSSSSAPLSLKKSWFLTKMWFMPLTFSYSLTTSHLSSAKTFFSQIENAWLLHMHLVTPATQLGKPGWAQTYMFNAFYMSALSMIPLIYFFV